jgi:hypothetical protein
VSLLAPDFAHSPSLHAPVAMACSCERLHFRIGALPKHCRWFGGISFGFQIMVNLLIL